MKDNMASTEAGFGGSSNGGPTQALEGLSVELTPAPIRKRILAYAIDIGILSLVLNLALIVIGLAAVLIGGGILFLKSLEYNLTVGSIWMVGLAVLAVILLLLGLLFLWHGYFVYYEYKKGATPGKKTLGLRVISVRDNRLTLSQVVYRDMLRYVDVGLMCLPGLVSILVTQRKQRLGDLATGTLVVYSREVEEEQRFLYVSSEQYRALHAELAPKPITQAACEAFLRTAYPIFITGQMQFSRVEFDDWVDELGGKFSNSQQVDKNPSEIVLRFYAEYCLQVLNRITRGK